MGSNRAFHEAPLPLFTPAPDPAGDEALLSRAGLTAGAGRVPSYLADHRARLRERFMQADIGISGVNFAIASDVAESVTLCLFGDDGTGRTTEERVRMRDDEHRTIAEAIAARDPDRAEEAMYEHLERTQRKLTGRLGSRSTDAA